MAAFNSNPLNFPNLVVKSAPVGADIIMISDSAASGVIKQTLISDLPFAPASGSTVVNVTTATQQMAINTEYYANYATASPCTLTLPVSATASQGSFVKVKGGEASANPFIIGQLASQTQRMFQNVTTAGGSGTLTGDNAFNFIEETCDATSGGLTWVVGPHGGNWTGA